MSIFLLYLLAVFDFACCGYRAAGGRIARLDKRAYFKDAMVFGAIRGHSILIVMVVALAVIFELEPDKKRFLDDLSLAAQAALSVYMPYSFLVFTALILRITPSVDLKSIACTVLLGPLLFIRPLITVIGIVSAAAAAGRDSITVLAILVAVMILLFEKFLERRFASPE